MRRGVRVLHVAQADLVQRAKRSATANPHRARPSIARPTPTQLGDQAPEPKPSVRKMPGPTPHKAESPLRSNMRAPDVWMSGPP